MLTGAGEIVRYDGAWQVPDATRKYNGFLRYSEGTADNGFALTALAYTNSWHSSREPCIAMAAAKATSSAELMAVGASASSASSRNRIQPTRRLRRRS